MIIQQELQILIKINIEKTLLSLQMSMIKEEILIFQEHFLNLKNCMLNINKGEPWLFWPSSICDTFPENPSNLLLSGDKSFEFTLDFILKDNSIEQKTVFALVPRYTGLDLYKNETVITITYEDKARYYRLPMLIDTGITTSVKFDHKPKQYLKVFINKEEVVNESLENKTFGISKSPHIIFGAGNFPKNDFNLNYTDLDLLRFSIFQDGNILTDHFFEERIFDKYVDVTGNLNFIHKI